MIFLLLALPMPGKVSNCSAVAVFRSTLAALGAAASALRGAPLNIKAATAATNKLLRDNQSSLMASLLAKKMGKERLDRRLLPAIIDVQLLKRSNECNTAKWRIPHLGGFFRPLLRGCGAGRGKL